MLYKRNCEIKSGVDFPTGMQRIALGVEYHGSAYSGFQKQKHNPQTVQACLERGISQVAHENEAISLVCAGRTDAGVHASGQVVHFDTLALRNPKAWVQGVNTHLPRDIRVTWAKAVGPSFHARFSARSRTYRYVFCVSDVRPATLGDGLAWHAKALDFKAMQQAAQILTGEHDFSAFRSSQCQANNAVREVKYLDFFESGTFVVMEIQANAFLHHMVRNIVGALLEVGTARKSADWLREHLSLKNRALGPPTADGGGLYLVAVEYSAAFALPFQPAGPRFISNPQRRGREALT